MHTHCWRFLELLLPVIAFEWCIRKWHHELFIKMSISFCTQQFQVFCWTSFKFTFLLGNCIRSYSIFRVVQNAVSLNSWRKAELKRVLSFCLAACFNLARFLLFYRIFTGSKVGKCTPFAHQIPGGRLQNGTTSWGVLPAGHWLQRENHGWAGIKGTGWYHHHAGRRWVSFNNRL